jgi:myosin heavy subunit
MNKTTKIILSAATIIIVLLVSLLVYNLNQLAQKEENIKEMEQVMEFEKQASIEEFEQLSRQYEEFYIETNNDSLLKLIDEEKQKVKQLLQELKTVKATNARRIRELQKELGTVRGVLKQYVAQVDSLNHLNTKLKQENVKVRKQYENATKTVKEMEEKNAELDKIIGMASILEAQGITVKTLNNRGKETKRLKRITKLEICFTILRNITAERGEKTVYLRINDPIGGVMGQTPQKVFLFEENNIAYSAKKKIAYGGENTDVCIYYDVETTLETGTYNIGIFADGNLIGTTGFVLQ